MLKFVVLLSAIACALGAALPEGMEPMSEGFVPELDGRIVGGSYTNINSFPWQISLQRNGGHSCGGSVYNNRIIVTAAHCLQGVSPSSLKVRAGSTYKNSGGVLVGVAAFKNHEGYNSASKANDVAVIRLSSSLAFGSTIRAIGLASSTPGHGASARCSGWGTTSSGGSSPTQLMFIDTKIVGRSQCASGSYGYGNKIGATMICAASPGKDSCQGDSGGPLVSNGQLVGIVSWGSGCAQARYPGVYADVAPLRSWIVNWAGRV